MGIISTNDWLRIRQTVLLSESEHGTRGPGDYAKSAGPIFPFGSWHPWGIVNVSGAVVTVAAGGLEAGPTYLESTQTEITLTGLAQFVGLEYNRGTGQLSVTGPHDERPVTTGDIYRTWLYVFDYHTTEGVAVFVRHNLTGLRLVSAL
jgi:hypothetical protein